jgi:hypothetical protein
MLFLHLEQFLEHVKRLVSGLSEDNKLEWDNEKSSSEIIFDNESTEIKVIDQNFHCTGKKMCFLFLELKYEVSFLEFHVEIPVFSFPKEPFFG